MHRSWRRPFLSFLAATALAVSGALALPAPAQAAATDLKINEVESNGGTPGDWIEILNTGNTTVDIGGFGVLDNDSGHSKVLAPVGTMIAAGGFYVFDTEVSFGLGQPDSATLYAADGSTVLDTYSWATHAATTYGRCPDGTGAFTTTVASTRGAANSCPAPAVAINEVESNGGAPGDWVEIKNKSGSTVDISGYQVKDNDNTHIFTVPAATSLAAGAYFVADTEPGFGLGVRRLRPSLRD